MPGQNTFPPKVTSRGADMFRAVSLCFLFIHKQRPTVITPSFKYQWAPLRVRPQRWPPVRPHDFSWKRPRGRNFHSLEAQRFSLFSRFSVCSLTSGITEIKPNMLCRFSSQCHIPWQKVPFHWKVPSEGQCRPPQPCLVTLGLHYTPTDITTHPPWFYFTTGSQSLTL